jgi:hypothetical protein
MKAHQELKKLLTSKQIQAFVAEYTFIKVVEINKLHPETECKIGVLGLETGELYSRPKRSEVSIERQNLVLQNAVYNYAFKDAKVKVTSLTSAKDEGTLNFANEEF